MHNLGYFNLHILAKCFSKVMQISLNRKLVSFQNCFGVLSRFRHRKGFKTFPHFKYRCGQRGACCLRDTG